MLSSTTSPWLSINCTITVYKTGSPKPLGCHKSKPGNWNVAVELRVASNSASWFPLIFILTFVASPRP